MKYLWSSLCQSNHTMWCCVLKNTARIPFGLHKIFIHKINGNAANVKRKTPPVSCRWSFLIRVNHNYGVDILNKSNWELFNYHFVCAQQHASSGMLSLCERVAIPCDSIIRLSVEARRERRTFFEWWFSCVCVTLSTEITEVHAFMPFPTINHYILFC